jgi:hypothetical protein
LIGTKFDDFIQLPIDMQWTIASEVLQSLPTSFLFFAKLNFIIRLSGD